MEFAFITDWQLPYKALHALSHHYYARKFSGFPNQYCLPIFPYFAALTEILAACCCHWWSAAAAGAIFHIFLSDGGSWYFFIAESYAVGVIYNLKNRECLKRCIDTPKRNANWQINYETYVQPQDGVRYKKRNRRRHRLTKGLAKQFSCCEWLLSVGPFGHNQRQH